MWSLRWFLSPLCPRSFINITFRFVSWLIKHFFSFVVCKAMQLINHQEHDEDISEEYPNGFGMLNDYQASEVFKYLGYVDQVKFERVNSRFKDLLTHQWLAVKKLDEDRLASITTLIEKKIKRERASEHKDDAINSTTLDKLIRKELEPVLINFSLRCPNLEYICLHWYDAMSTSSVKFTSKLVEKCPLLRKFCQGTEITAPNKCRAQVVRNYIMSNKKNQVDSLKFDLNKSKVKDVLRLLEHVPMLSDLELHFPSKEMHRNVRDVDKIWPLVGENLKTLVVYHPSRAFWEDAMEHCPNIVKLELKDSDDYAADENIISLVGRKLNKLTNFSTESSMAHMGLLANLQHLKSISWMDSSEDSKLEILSCQYSFVRLTKTINSNLLSVKLYIPNTKLIGEKNFQLLSKLCPNIAFVELSILSSTPADRKLITETLSAFQKLRTVVLSGVDLELSHLRFLLKTPKIKNLQLFEIDVGNQDFVQAIFEYGKQHPKRVITAISANHDEHYSLEVMKENVTVILQNQEDSEEEDDEEEAEVGLDNEGNQEVQ